MARAVNLIDIGLHAQIVQGSDLSSTKSVIADARHCNEIDEARKTQNFRITRRLSFRKDIENFLQSVHILLDDPIALFVPVALYAPGVGLVATQRLIDELIIEDFDAFQR